MKRINVLKYKILDLGGMTPLFEKIDYYQKELTFAPVEYLISLKVKGYNGDIATKEFDIYSIILIIAYLEGYYGFYYTYFYAPL